VAVKDEKAGPGADLRAAGTTTTLPRAQRTADVAGIAAGDFIGRYRVLEVLGAGGMGVVYGAFDPELQRKVALKLVRAEFAGLDIELRARLTREAQAMARIRHPNVITVFDVGTYADRLFVAMEVIDGWTLTSWQAARTRSVDEILRVFAAAGAGLAAAHAAGLVHRDFKPDNILIGGDGHVCVTDFGLVRPVAGALDEGEEISSPDATVEGELTRAGAVVGTPAYMAPEQMRGAPPDGRADQFSFCVALFEALYGVRPFPGKSLAELESAILGGQRLRARRKGVPQSVKRALARGLAGDPSARFDSMDELLRALKPARPRSMAFAAAAVAGFVGVTAAAGVLQWRLDRARLCRGAAGKLAGAWDAERRAALFAALGGDGGSADRAARVVAALDDYAGRWTHAWTDACEATRVRGEQSEARLDLRMQCLDERRKETEELTRLLVADHAVADKATQAVQALPSVAQCADVTALERPRRAPAAAQEKLELPRRWVARARAEVNSLKCADARTHAGDAMRDARALDDPALAARAALLLARAQRCLGEQAAARVTMVDGAVLAARAHDEVQLTLLASQAVQLDAQEANYVDAAHWVELADEAAARSNGDARAEADRLYGRALLEWRQDHLEAAVELHRRAARFYDQLEGPEADRLRNLGQLASVLGNMGRFAEAEPLHHQIHDAFARLMGPDNYITLTIDENIALEKWEMGELPAALAGERHFLDRVGPAAPSHLSTAQSNYGWMLLDAGRADEALVWLEKARASADRIDGKHDEETEYALAGIGAADVALGKPRPALPLLERALTLQQGAETDADRADTEFALARALTLLGRDRPRALAAAQHAREFWAAHPLGERRLHQLATVDAWLRGHAGAPAPHR
jgi:tRNA A-37 threonylcarbamoyl transferase component Bud32/tetratricopeptide (TPR) repeat protein